MHENILQGELESFLQKPDTTIAKMTLVGTALLAIYLLTSHFVEAKGDKEENNENTQKKSKKENDSCLSIVFSQIIEPLASKAMVVLLKLAQKKLSKTLKYKKITHEHPDHTTAKKVPK